MSEIKSKLDTKRVDLSEVLPLRTPFVIQIDPSSKCNFKCKFCPTSSDNNDGETRTTMDFQLFKKVIDDLEDFEDNIKVVKLWKDGEPLLNPYMSEMIKYTKQNQSIRKVELTTNGYLLNEKLNLKLIESGLDKIIISLEGLNEKDYFKNSGIKINFNNFIDNIKHFYENRKQCIVHIKIIDIDLTKDKKDEFFHLFNNISDEMFIEKAIPCWPGFEDKSINQDLSNVWGELVEKKEICTLPLYSLVINANGKVSMCCNDWQQKIIVGDANSQNIKEIWNSPEVNGFHILQLSKKRKTLPACSRCMYPDYVSIDNIDIKSLEILEKYKNHFNGCPI